MPTLADRVDTLPTAPGVYQFVGPAGEVLYVGKAVDLRARVRQYLGGHDSRAMVPFLVHAAIDVSVIVTRTEKEALLLENTLIKQHRPRYNVRLRDDSNFLHLRLHPREAWPMFGLRRRLASDGARWFGPYPSASLARETLAFAQRLFPLRTCSDAVLRSRTRPCLLHQMGRCVAPCVGKVDRETYRDIVLAAIRFLGGQRAEAVDGLRSQMTRAAAEERYEDAARARDLIRAIETTVERQSVVDPRLGDRDAWAIVDLGSHTAFAVLPVRAGAMGEPLTWTATTLPGTDAERLSSAVNSTYADGHVPAEILLPSLPADAEALSEILSERAGYRVTISAPQRGDKARLIDLARENAIVRQGGPDAGAALAELLDLDEPVRHIEGYDVSHLAGRQPVASRVTFIDGRQDRQRTRRIRLRDAPGGDDIAGLREAVSRRLAHQDDPLPDLFLIDGGPAQVAAIAALTNVAVVGLMKPHEAGSARRHAGAQDRIVPERGEPIVLPPRHPGLKLLQAVRNAAHETAIRYQRKVRIQRDLTSALQDIPGIGPSRRDALLRHFGSAGAVLAADVEALGRVPGISRALARRICDAVDGG